MNGYYGKTSSLISKLFIHQFGLTVFGMLLYSAAAVSGNHSLVIGFSVFSALFYLFLLYVLMWETGASDKIRIDGGRMKKDVFKGFKVTLLANIPNYVFAVASTLGYLFIDRSVVDASGNFTTPEWAINVHAISQTVGFYLNSMYAGIADGLGISTAPYWLFILTVPSLIVCGLGYWLGTRELFGLPSSGTKRD